MNPFEIFGLMALGGAIVFVLLTAMLRLESRLMNGVVQGDRRSRPDEHAAARHGDSVEATDLKVVANDIVSMNERIRTLHAAVRQAPAFDHLEPLVRHAARSAATARPFAVGDSHRVGKSAAEFAAVRLRLLEAQPVLRVFVDVLARAARPGASPQ